MNSASAGGLTRGRRAATSRDAERRAAAFAAGFTGRLAAVSDLAGVVRMQRELAHAVYTRVVGPEMTRDLAAQCTARRGQLRARGRTGPRTSRDHRRGGYRRAQAVSNLARAEPEQLAATKPRSTDRYVVRLLMPFRVIARHQDMAVSPLTVSYGLSVVCGRWLGW